MIGTRINKTLFNFQPCEEITHSDTDTNTDTEENRSAVDTIREFREPEPKSKPPKKKKKLSQLTSMVNQLKEISETANSTTEENEFEAFGKHVGLQLKALPLLLALQAQEQIQLYINRIRREHLQNASEQNRFTRTNTPLSSYDSQDSPYSHTSTYSIDTNYYEEQPTQDTSFTPQSIQSTQEQLPQDTSQRNATVTSNDVISTAINNAYINL